MHEIAATWYIHATVHLCGLPSVFDQFILSLVIDCMLKMDESHEISFIA